MKPAIHSRQLYLLFFAICLLFSCTTQQKTKVPEEEIQAVKNILVLPAQATTENKEPVDEQLEKGVMVMNRDLMTYFEGKKYARFVAADESAKQMPGGNRLTLIQNLGRKFNSGAVLLCSMSRYIERIGTKYASESPASVAFECKLVEVETGRALCFLSFDETQQALSENLLSLPGVARRGLKWLTAEQLLNDGLTKKLDTCPYLKH